MCQSSFVQVAMATRQRHSLLDLKCGHWAFKRVTRSALYNLVYAKGMWQGALYPQQTNYLFANISLFISREADEATLPSFATGHATIKTSNALLEVLIASLLLVVGSAREATLPMAIKLLIAVKSLFLYFDGEQTTMPICTSIGFYNALFKERISHPMQPMRFLTMGMLTFSGWARGPLWRPPSGHFFLFPLFKLSLLIVLYLG